jgi:hypothetical protein
MIKTIDSPTLSAAQNQKATSIAAMEAPSNDGVERRAIPASPSYGT